MTARGFFSNNSVIRTEIIKKTLNDSGAHSTKGGESLDIHYVAVKPTQAQQENSLSFKGKQMNSAYALRVSCGF